MSLDGVTTEELARELFRRKRADIEEFAVRARSMSDDELKLFVTRYDCDYEQLYQQSAPANHCEGCVAQELLDERAREEHLRQQLQPGERPVTCTSCSSGAAHNLRPGDVLARRLYPGVDTHDYVIVLDARPVPGIAEQLVIVTFQRTNDPDSATFDVTYPARTYIRSIWRRL